MRTALALGLLAILHAGCGGASPAADDAGRDAAGHDAATADTGIEGDAATEDDASSSDDASTRDVGTSDAGRSCLAMGHAAGERYPLGDRCNFCDCAADGTSLCSDRTCLDSRLDGCTYDGAMHGYGERFPSTDGCNECVCATSGLACTRRTATCPGTVEEGAILLEDLNEACGPDMTFTAGNVLGALPHDGELALPFLYERGGALYPETLPDTGIQLRIVRDDDGYAVCRIPMPGQEAIDLEVLIEWYTVDGAFDETFHAYLRRNAGGFTNVWTIAASVAPGALNGTYRPGCPDFRGYAFDATLDFDGSATGAAYKTCEADIALPIGHFTLAAP